MNLNSIRVFAPANPVVSQTNIWPSDWFPDMKVQEPMPSASWHGLHGSDAVRASELAFLAGIEPHTLYLAGRGGYGTMRALRHFLKTSQIQQPGSKHHAICGFSDLTVLLNVLPAYGFHVWHGPHLTFPQKPVPDGLMHRSLRALLNGQTASFEWAGSKDDGQFEGRLIGGNLSVFLSLMGTGFEPEFKDRILILEDVGETTYRLDRMLLQILELPGLKSLQAVCLGQFTSCHPQENGGFNADLEQVIEQFILECPVPVLQNLPFGHIQDMLVLPMDRPVRLYKGEISWDARPENV